ALNGKELTPVSLSPDGRTLAAAARGDKQVRLWDVRARKELEPLPIKPGRSKFSVAPAVGFSPDGKLLAVTSEGEVGVWDVAARKEVQRLKGREPDLGIPVFSRDGKRLAAGDGRGVALWDLTTGEPCHDLGHGHGVAAVAFAPDGRSIV